MTDIDKLILFHESGGHEGSCELELCKTEIASLRAERDALRVAAIGIRDDLIERARWDDDVKVVCAGNGAWHRLNKALGDDHAE